jgi:hypothetical protein
MIKKIPIKSKSRWKVVFQDTGSWRCGFYVPENESKDEIKFLEKHNIPEFFLLIEGEVSLLIKENEKLKVLPLKKNEIVIVDTYHNGFRPDGKKGIALVVERDTFETTYLNLKTGKTKKVKIVKGKLVK